MSSIGKVGGYSSSRRWRNLSMSRRGLRALTSLGANEHAPIVLQAHEATDALRKFGERLREGDRDLAERKARFELEQETGEISLMISDPETGEVRLKLSPEEVAKGLKRLEESEDNSSSLTSFFVDVTA